MGVVQTKEAGSAAAASTPTVAAATSDAPTAPVPPPHTPPPSAAVLDDLELSDLTKPDGDATADASGVDPVADWVRGSDEGGAEGDGEDEGDRAESLEEGGKEEAVRVEKGERKAKVRPLYPRRPGQPDCTFYVESGYCKFKAYCKFDHPPNRRKGRKGQYNKQPAADQMDAERNSNMKEGDKRIKYPQRPDATDCTFYTKTGTCNFGSACRFNHPPDRKMNKTDSERNSNMKEGDKRIKYPQRPDATDCTFYTKTGTCKFGSACRFNHPPDRKMNKAKVEKQSAHIQVGERKQQTPKQSITLKNNMDVNEESKKASTKNFGQKGKDNTTTRACMFEISKHSNQVGVKEAPSVALNFLNLPIRPGAKECPQYMSEGSCKFGINCKHHHPDPTAMNEQDLLSRNQDGQCIQQFGSGQSPSSGTPWHVSTSYTAGMHLPYGLYPNPECNGYQVPMLQPEMHTQNPSASPVNFVDNKTNALMHQQVHVEYPERPGQPECQYFKKTGICKFRSACKFHHPRNHLAKNSNSNSEPR